MMELDLLLTVDQDIYNCLIWIAKPILRVHLTIETVPFKKQETDCAMNLLSLL